MNPLKTSVLAALALVLAVCTMPASCAETPASAPWVSLFNGTNLDGWSVHLENLQKNQDPGKLVQVADGAIQFYKDATAGSKPGNGYIVTDKEYSSYRFRFEFKWGDLKFGAKRNSGLLYHTTMPDKIWPESVEYQIQENDCGDVFAMGTRVTSPVETQTTNVIISFTTNRTSGEIRTNSAVTPRYLETDQGGILFVQGQAGSNTRIIRNPVNEHEGWNVVEVEVRGDRATHFTNGKLNNRCQNMERWVDGQWKPLVRGRIGLQLEGAQILFRKLEIQELRD